MKLQYYHRCVILLSVGVGVFKQNAYHTFMVTTLYTIDGINLSLHNLLGSPSSRSAHDDNVSDVSLFCKGKMNTTLVDETFKRYKQCSHLFKKGKICPSGFEK